MKNFLQKSIWRKTILLLFIFLSGCSYPVDSLHIDKANYLCKNNDGLDYIFPDIDYINCYCNNGAKFVFDRTIIVH